VSIRLPREAITEKGRVMYFAVDVIPDSPGQAPWRVMRRYRWFHYLSTKVLGTVAPFPPKHWFSACKGQDLENRRAGIELWLKIILALAPVRNGDVELDLSSFLILRRSALPASAPPLDVLDASAPPARPDDDSLVLLSVELPPGVSYGDLVSIEVPSGTVAISVPWGIAPGSGLDLWYDPSAGTVSLHSQQDWQGLRQA